MASLLPLPRFFFPDANGDPLVGGKVYTYAAGTSTPLASYTDYSGTVPNANPVILDSSGTAAIWLGNALYKIVLRDANDVLIWTTDNVGNMEDVVEASAFGQATDVASASLVDLGNVTTHFANITGTTNINSFGATASITNPIYLVKFEGALTLVNSSTLLLPAATNILTTSQDRMLVEYLGSGTWRVFDYNRADGSILNANAVATINIQDNAVTTPKLDALTRALYRSKAPPPISNNVTDANNDIDVAVGSCVSDGNVLLNLTSVLTKRLDANWAVGTNQGGLDTGGKALSTTYHVFLISNGTVVDALFSTSATTPLMPTGYTEKRRIGAIRTDASNNILAFTQNGDEFLLASPFLSYIGAGTTTATLTNLLVPTGISVVALIFGTSFNGGAATLYRYISSPLTADVASPGFSNIGAGATATVVDIAYSLSVRTNTSGQIRQRSSAVGGGLNINTYGWIDRRGRDD